MPAGRPEQCDATRAATAVEETVDTLLNCMTLEEKLGQLFMVGFSGTEPDAGIREWIERCHLGNVVLFAGNLVDPPQVLRLTSELQGLARAAQEGQAGEPTRVAQDAWAARQAQADRLAARAQGHDFFIPLFVAADQEGGIVVRLTRGATVFPGNMALGAARDPELARRAAAVMGSEMRAVGIQFNLAPVLDVNNNPRNPVIGVRSYGEDPELVAELGAAQIEGYQQFVVATAKHFPGHGDTAVDSHMARPVVGHGRERLFQVELLPFRRAIAAGVEAIMTAHMSVPAIEPDPRLPATLSRRVITGLLREELGYDGIIITDSLGMRGVSAEYDMVEASLLALEAGCDLLCASSHTYYGTFVYDAVFAAVRAGRISEERIEESARRVLRAKVRLGLLGDVGIVQGKARDQAEAEGYGEIQSQVVNVTLAEVGSAAHRAVAQEVARRAITLVQGSAELPTDIETVVVVEFAAQAQTGVEDLRLERGAERAAERGAGRVDAPGAVAGGSGAKGQVQRQRQEQGQGGDGGPLARALREALGQRQSHWSSGVGVRVLGLVLPLSPDPGLRQRLLTQFDAPGQATPGKVAVVVATLDAMRNGGQADLIRELADIGVPVRVISLRNPYELSSLGAADKIASFLAAYSPQPVSLAASAEALAGLLTPTGRLPITIA